MDVIHVEAPHGPVWVFLMVFVVLVAGPPLVERARLPGLIGLIAGGYAIGPNGIAAVDASDTTVPNLGTLGLLYLMFMAGVELDLALVARSRRAVSVFAALTFGFPMAFGFLAGLALDYGTEASLLLGSLLASHTLLVYPEVRRAGLGNDPATAAAVGATVGCDTLALVVLAAVAGSVAGDSGGLELLVQIAVGLAFVVAASLLLLPRIAALVFRTFGVSAPVRYTFSVAAFLSAGVLAEMFGIEHIVGAFFAGLAMNRLVPNDGPLMHRVEFFGNAVFVPVFLVSVGLIMDPAVMADPETLGLAGLFTLACLGGKAIAAALARPALGFSWAQCAVMYTLTSPQAAATLAATIVGFEIGLFGTQVLNAILVVILASVVLDSTLAPIATRRIERHDAGPPPVGHHVLVVIDGTESDRLLVEIAGTIARPDGGHVSALVLVERGDEPPGHDAVASIHDALASSGVDLDVLVRADETLADGVGHTARAVHATLVLTNTEIEVTPDCPAVVVTDGVTIRAFDNERRDSELWSRLHAAGLAQADTDPVQRDR